jgi:hypothetical protein
MNYINNSPTSRGKHRWMILTSPLIAYLVISRDKHNHDVLDEYISMAALAYVAVLDA